MEIQKQQFFPGPNLVALHRAARVVISEHPSPFIALDRDVIQKVHAIFHEVLAHRAEGLTLRGNCLAQLAGSILICLQQASRHPVRKFYHNRLSRTRVAIGFEIIRKSMLTPLVSCLEDLVAEARMLVPPGTFAKTYADVEKRLAYRLSDFISDNQSLAARRLGVCIRHESFGTIHLGEGFRSRLLGKGFTEVTKKLGYRFAQDKMETAKILQEYGLPTPRQRRARTLPEALEAAHRIGYPVVVKPRGGNKGTGVSVNVRTDEEVQLAYRYAEEDGSGVIVESHIPGTDHRLLVINGEVAAAVRRIPARIVGDGIHCISGLMEIANRLERRDGLYLFPLTFDDEVEQTLAKQGFTVDTIPEQGRTIFLRGAANQSLGGTTVDVTDVVHPDNRIAAIAAAEACLLDVAGIDFVIPDIRQSWREQGGGIVEINAGPGVDLHLAPTVGSSRDISRLMVRALFPAGTPSHIPTFLVAGRTRKRQTSRYLSALLSLVGHQPGLYIGGKVLVDGQEAHSGDYESALSALLDHRSISAAVIECSPSALEKHGTVLESVSVAVLIDSTWFGGTTKDLAAHATTALPLQQLVASITREGVVIDGTQASLRTAVEHLPAGQVVQVWADMESDRSPLERHLEAGGQALSFEIGPEGAPSLLYRRGTRTTTLLAGDAPHENAISQIREMMLAFGALIALGWQPEHFSMQLRTLWRLDSPSNMSLVCRREGPGWFAMCDPRDTAGISHLTELCRCCPPPALSVIISDGDCLAGFDEGLIQQLEPFEPAWCGASPAAAKIAETLAVTGVPGCRIHTFAHVDSAVRILNQRMIEGAMQVLFSCDITERKRFARLSLPPPPAALESQPLWTPKELAQHFSGVWAGGPAHGWGADSLAWGDHAVRTGDVTIIPGRPCSTDATAETEKQISSAFKQGARAVIATVQPPELSRWLPIMVCDDPELGLDRLATAARNRSRRLFVALSCGKEEAIVATLRQAWSSLLGAGESLFLDDTAPSPDLHASKNLALSLSRTPADAGLALFPVGWEPLAMQLLKPTLWIAVIADERDEPYALATARSLPPDCQVLASMPEALLERWRKRASGLPLSAWTLIGPCDDPAQLAIAAHALIVRKNLQATE